MTVELETLLVQRKKALEETSRLEKQIEELTSRLEEEETALQKVNASIAHLLGIKASYTPAEKLTSKPKLYQPQKILGIVTEAVNDEPKTVRDIAAEIGIDQIQVSRALTNLKKRNLVARIGWSKAATWVKGQQEGE